MPEGSRRSDLEGLPLPAPEGTTHRAVYQSMLPLVLCLFVVTSAAFQESSHDAWWHLATGDWILEHRAIPREDPFSSTATGEPWIDHEWGFQVVLSVVHRAGGVPGLIALKIAIVCGIAALLWIRCAIRTSDSRRC